MSKASRSRDSGDNFNALEALGFIAPEPTPPVAPTVAVPATVVASAAVVMPAAGTVPLTRRQLREQETLRNGGAPSAESPRGEYPSRERRGENPPPVAFMTSVASAAPTVPTASTAGNSAPGAGGNYSRTAPTARIEPKRGARKRFASHLFSGAAMVFAAALLVGTTVPANAFMPTSQELADAPAPVSVKAETQSMAVSGDVVEATPVRAKFTVTSYADMLRQQYGNISYNYAITTGAVRWPFPFVSPISSGFGGRVAPCRGCSSMHMGLDFVPGAGTPIYAIADGVISEHKIETWGLGNSVVISHTIGGKAVDSVYAHMQTGSVVVEAGQEIKVGDLIGLVGSTGTSTGSHLHFEIHIDGVQVDPYAWLQTNVKN